MNRNYQTPMLDVILLNDDVVSASTYVDMSQFISNGTSTTNSFYGGDCND